MTDELDQGISTEVVNQIIKQLFPDAPPDILPIEWIVMRVKRDKGADVADSAEE